MLFRKKVVFHFWPLTMLAFKVRTNHFRLSGVCYMNTLKNANIVLGHFVFSPSPPLLKKIWDFNLHENNFWVLKTYSYPSHAWPRHYVGQSSYIKTKMFFEKMLWLQIMGGFRCFPEEKNLSFTFDPKQFWGLRSEPTILGGLGFAICMH